MHMMDWNTYRQQLVAGVGGFGKLNPDIVKGWRARCWSPVQTIGTRLAATAAGEMTSISRGTRHRSV
jgi:hypothetical protein